MLTASKRHLITIAWVLSMIERRVSNRLLGMLVGLVCLTVIISVLVGLSILAIVSLLVFILAIFLIATELLTRATAALLGATLILIAFFLSGYDLGYFIHHVELDTILTLLGIIIVASLGLRSGLFYFIGVKVAKLSGGDPIKLYFILAVFTFLANIAVIAIATVLVVVSLTLAICDILKIDPKPYIIMEIFIVNVGASSTLISAVPNIIIAEETGLTFGFFIVNLLPFAAISFLISTWLLFRVFSPQRTVDPIRALAIMELDEWLFVKDRTEFYLSAIAIVGMIMGFIVFRVLIIVSLLFAVLCLAVYSKPDELLRDVDWDTLLFFVGFYIIVAALSETHILEGIANGLIGISGGNFIILLSLLFWISVIISGFVDNIPYVLVLIPIVKILLDKAQYAPYAGLFWMLLILACNIGGGLNPYSAPQNLLALSAARKGGHPISNNDYYKVSIKWLLINGSLGYLYGLAYIFLAAIIAHIGYTTFILIVVLIVLLLILMIIHRLVGLRYMARYIRSIITEVILWLKQKTRHIASS